MNFDQIIFNTSLQGTENDYINNFRLGLDILQNIA